MDQNTSVRKAITIGCCLLIALFLRPALVGAASLEEGLDHETINMEEMKIQGSLNKPKIMYVIPRANLPVTMKLNDEYFLPSAVDLEEAVCRAGQKEDAASFEPAPPSSAPTFPACANTRDIQEGSCVSCHYLEMDLPKNSRSTLLLRELNQICIKCHPSRYYHICWQGIETMAFLSAGQAKESLDSRINLGKTPCSQCHAFWIQPKGERKLSGGVPEQGYDIDIFCITCHKRKGY